MTEVNADNCCKNNFESQYTILIKYQSKSNEIKRSICYFKEVYYLFYIGYNFLVKCIGAFPFSLSDIIVLHIIVHCIGFESPHGKK